jgi:DNA-directed RNA polymerase subunit F
MLVAKVENNQIIKIADYREMFPNISFAASGIDKEFMDANNLLYVTIWKAHTDVEKLVNSDSYIENSQVYTVKVEPKTEAEISSDIASKAAKIRAERNAKLADTVDKINPLRWEAMTDDQKEDWRTYRNDLLNVPEQVGFPDNVIWPELP